MFITHLSSNTFGFLAIEKQLLYLSQEHTLERLKNIPASERNIVHYTVKLALFHKKLSHNCELYHYSWKAVKRRRILPVFDYSGAREKPYKLLACKVLYNQIEGIQSLNLQIDHPSLLCYNCL
jgi:CRISPR/Cas system-associated protein Cas5 (RAMP superfamily)